VSAEDEGVEGNARMTALLGAILLVAFAAEGVTVLDVNQLFTWHVFIGLFIVPIVCIKLATTGYRFFNYYRGTAQYRRKGVPHPILRITAPLLVLSTISLLFAGIVALAVGPRHSDTWITIHQGSAIAWATFVAIHLIGHALETWRLTNAEMHANPPIPRRGARTTVVAVGLVVGLILGLVSLGWTGAWKNRERHGAGVAPPSAVVRANFVEDEDTLGRTNSGDTLDLSK
jgi:hypothetical protein